MNFTTFVLIYLFGGLTFIPLVLAALLIAAWKLLPQSNNDGPKDQITVEEKNSEQDEKAAVVNGEQYTGDGGASGTFAVLRRHDFPAANTALSAKNVGGNPAGGVGTADGQVDVGGGSESVYQSMYRSVFDRAKAAASSSSLLETEAAGPATGRATRRNSVTANVFYIVLRHGHLMLYDSAAQLEVRHVIGLSHYTISLAEGVPPGQKVQEESRDGDLFIKRTAIVLTPMDLPCGQLQREGTSTSRPFYLFSATCSEKEDFYHALLYTRSKPPVPLPLQPSETIKLQSALHSTSLTPETRALNALVGRVFLALHQTDYLKTLIRTKVEKKISRVQKPAFIASLAVQSISLGDSAPLLSNPRLRDFNISGDMTLAFDVRYTGGVKLTIAAVARLDLGSRFKTRTADLVLASSLQRLVGRILVRVKPPPTNRIWFCFENMPEMDIKVEPVVSQRQITYTFILRAIEERIRSVVGETLVKPNWDDIPFFDTRGQRIRAGIWSEEGSEDLAPSSIPSSGTVHMEPATSELLRHRNEKTMSMPVFPVVGAETDSSGPSSGSETTSKIATSSSSNVQNAALESNLKRRSVTSLPGRSTSVPQPEDLRAPLPPLQQPPKPLRSPSIVQPSPPLVALSDANAEKVRSDEAGDQSAPSLRLWRTKPPSHQQGPSARMEAATAMRKVQDRAFNVRGGRSPVTGPSETLAAVSNSEATEKVPGAQNVSIVQHDASGDEGSIEGADSPTDDATFPPSAVSGTSTRIPSMASRTMRGPSSKRADFDVPGATTTTPNSSTQDLQQRKTLLAATAAATTAARNWSWNAIANRTGKGSATSAPRGLNGLEGIPADKREPLGRGQPLPPPGIPLPGPPQKGLFTGLTSVKRKPILPPRRTETTDSQDSKKSEASLTDSAERESKDDKARVSTSDEFGPWTHNSGISIGESLEPTQVDENANANLIGIETEEGASVLPSGEELSPSLQEQQHKESAAVGQPDGVENKVPPPLPMRRQTNRAPKVSSPDPVVSQTGTDRIAELGDRGDENHMQPSQSTHESSIAAPITESPTQSLDSDSDQADLKFVRGEHIAEEDFKRGRSDMSTDDTDEPEHDRAAVTVPSGDIVVRIAAPVENTPDDGDCGLAESNAK